MRFVALLLVAVALVGCTPTMATHARRTTFAMAVMSTACDWGSTRRAAAMHWRDRMEANPILGRSPSVTDVDIYMASALALTAGVGYLFPRIAPYLYGGVALVEADAAAGNFDTVPGVCGITTGSVGSPDGPATARTVPR